MQIQSNSEYEWVKKEFSDIAGSGSYRKWRDYIDNKEAINNALNVKAEDRTEEDKKLINIKDKYDADENARANKLTDRFNSALIGYEISNEDDIINFNNFEKLANDLNRKAKKVQSKMQTAKEQREKLGKTLAEDITQELKAGIEDSVKIFDELVLNGDCTSQCYIDLAQRVSENKDVNIDYNNQMQKQIFQLARISCDYVSDPAVDEIEDYMDPLYENKYHNFQDNDKYSNLYRKLAAMFEEGDNEQQKQAKDQKDKAKELQKNAESELNKTETTGARSIPGIIPIGDAGNSGSHTINLIKNAAGYFKMNSFAEAGNKLLLKFYVFAYDYGMFSSRVTNIVVDTVVAPVKVVPVEGIALWEDYIMLQADLSWDKLLEAELMNRYFGQYMCLNIIFSADFGLTIDMACGAYIGKKAYIYVLNDAAAGYDLTGDTIVNEIGNIAFMSENVRDVIIMIER